MNFRTANGTTNLGDHSKDDMCAKKKEESGNRGVREKEKARRGETIQTEEHSMDVLRGERPCLYAQADTSAPMEGDDSPCSFLGRNWRGDRPSTDDAPTRCSSDVEWVSRLRRGRGKAMSLDN